MATIKAIEASTVHQIQSGQVIVDLCSVVKELVENCLDAGASSVDVRFKNQGLDCVEVQDNGSGISAENYETTALKHYTSKLSTFSDLGTLKTFGFRGEALSSLCAVSNLTITTCIAADAPKATKLEFEASGRLRQMSFIAGQKGSIVTVQNLFHNLPVRRRELERNVKREWNKVVMLLNQYACIQTGLKFTVSQQPSKGKRIILFATKGNPTTRENLINIFGAKTMGILVKLDLILEFEPTAGSRAWQRPHTSTRVRVQGFVSRPAHGEGRQMPDRQMFFVNGRPCIMPQFAKTFNEVYKTYNASQSPFILADIQLDTHLYDVNVSPDKRTILMHEQGRMLEELRGGLLRLFESQDYSIPKSQLLPPAPTSRDIPKTISSNISCSTSVLRRPTSLEERDDDEDELSTSIVGGELARMGRSQGHRIAQQPSNIAARSSQTSASKDSRADNFMSRWMATRSNQPELASTTHSHPEVAHTTLLGGLGASHSSSSMTTTPVAQNPGVVSGASQPQESTCSPHSLATTSSIDLDEGTEGSHPKPSIPGTSADPESGRLLSKAPRPQISNAANINTSQNRESVDTDTKTVRPLTLSSVERDTVTGGNQTAMDQRESLTRQTHPGKAHDASSLDHGSTRDSRSSNARLDQMTLVGPSATSPPDSPNLATDVAGDSSTPSPDGSLQQQLFDGRVQCPASPDGESMRPHFSQLPSTCNTRVVGQDSDTDPISMLQKGPPSKDGEKSKPQRTSRGKYAALHCLQKIELDATMVETSATDWCVQAKNHGSHLEPKAVQGGVEANDAEETLSLIVAKADFARMTLVGQFNLGFVLAIRHAKIASGEGQIPSSGDQLFIIDQHASDEKYNFERLQATTVVQSQRLVQPKQLQLTALEEEIVRGNIPALELNGFQVRIDESGMSPVGARCELVALPLSRETTFSIQDLEELISLLGDDAACVASPFPRPSKVRRMLAMRACRSSIMIGKALARRQMETLVRHMGELDKPWNCPHGRPTMRHLCGLEPWNERGWREDKITPKRISWAKYTQCHMD